MWSFTVRNEGKNPVPYTRVTKRQLGNHAQFNNYVEFKDRIRGAFIDKYGIEPHDVFKLKTKYYVTTMIYFKKLDGTRGDPDNINKGVLDAIFSGFLEDDWIAGIYDFDEDKNDPRLEIQIFEGDYDIEVFEDNKLIQMRKVIKL